VPALALVLFVVSFFAKVAGGVKWAGILFALVVAQVMLGGLAHDYPWLGALHGLNALAVFGVALLAAHRARPVRAPLLPAAGADRAAV
jgi:heme A synthase